MANDDGFNPPPVDGKTAAELAEFSISKGQIIEIFETSFNDLSGYLLPIVGNRTLDAIFRNALRETKRKHPILASSTQSNPNQLLEKLRSENISPDELLRAILDYMQSIIELLTELTGDVLAKKAKGVVTGITEKLGDDHYV